MKKRSGYNCPICQCWYSPLLRKAGQRCNDKSAGQKVNCVGRLIPAEQYANAEWRDVNKRKFIQITEYAPPIPSGKTVIAN